MSTIEEIEAAVSRLAPSDYEKFHQWMVEYDNRRWDEEMEEDAKAGRFEGWSRRRSTI